MKKIKIDLTGYPGVVLIPDAHTQISSQDYAMTVPSVIAESSGSYIQKKANQVLISDFATHIHDLASKPVSVVMKTDSGTSEFTIGAKKLVGGSYSGISSWQLFTSNDWICNLAEAVIEKTSDLNQSVLALAIKAGGRDFNSPTEDKAIKKSMNTIQCLKKN